MSVDDVRAIAERLDPVPEIVSLDPHTLGEVLGDVRTLAQATDSKDAGVDLVNAAAARVDRVRLAVKDAPRRRVAMLEWLDPVFVGGHWVPQLIEYAGGVDLLGLPGEPSEQRSWEEVAAARPEVVVVAPCGYDVERGAQEAETYRAQLEALAQTGSSWPTRPPGSPAPARASWTAWSGSPTRCTRTASRSLRRRPRDHTGVGGETSTAATAKPMANTTQTATAIGSTCAGARPAPRP